VFNFYFLKVGATLIDIETAASSTAAAVPVEDNAAAAATYTSFSLAGAAPVIPPEESAVPFSRQAGIPAPGKFLTTPAVRRIARENGLDLAMVSASGPKGRIVKEDVLQYLKNKTSATASGTGFATASNQQQQHHQQQHSSGTSSTSSSSSSSAVAPSTQRLPIRGVQRMMVKSMTESLKVRKRPFFSSVCRVHFFAATFWTRTFMKKNDILFLFFVVV
jgi:pyruvate/2-oxoglutarate dehydrogenase complex dihydrolipoamide acyltransferase (E2) component